MKGQPRVAEIMQGLRDQNWQTLIVTECGLRHQILGMGDDPRTKVQRSEALRAWWGQISHMLEFAYRNSEMLPFDLMLILSQMSEYLHRGIIPEPILDVTTRGRRVIGPEEERHISYATAYIRAVKARKLPGRFPIKTIAKRYGISRQAAQVWARREIPADLERMIDATPRRLVRRLVAAAKKYRNGAGRSSGALTARQTRQRK